MEGINTVGSFNITVSSAYPVYLRLSHDSYDDSLLFTHKELSDLEYLIKWAKRESKIKLKGHRSADEVD
jgi:hypothetical protein